MRKFLFFLSVLLSFTVYSQDTLNAVIDEVKQDVRTISGTGLVMKLIIDSSRYGISNFALDNEKFDETSFDLNPRLVSAKYKNLINQGEKIGISTSRTAINVKITNMSKQLINLLQNDMADIYITIDQDILFEAWDGANESTLKLIRLDRRQFEESTRTNKSRLTETMARELIDANGGDLFISQNQFDFGIIPAEESSSKKTEFNASFKIRTKYKFLNKAPVFLYSEGLISSNSKDSLNHLSLYPINYNFFSGKTEMIGQLGVESDQLFSNYRITGNFYWNTIIPNIINLTFGEDRLRLKPVVKLGFKLYKEVKNNRVFDLSENEFSNQIFGSFYYHIPIQKNYSLIIDGSAFYDFNIKVNPDKKVMASYSVALGIEIPNADMKTIFKYSKGQNGITYKKDDFLMIGLMIDLIGMGN